ncbi:MAG: proteobacterial dedicated sortase system histidine kinase [Vicinamibacteria bacterium]|nr:proteobacterial dedicated sortase system histidine kinase [Vicinamibacteria bacterium]
MRLGLRAQLLIVSSLLLALPLLGLRSAREVEAFLVETQEQGLSSTARAVATALNERPGIFLLDPTEGATDRSFKPSETLRIETLFSPLTVDGLADDWTAQRVEFHEVTPPPAASAPAPKRLESLGPGPADSEAQGFPSAGSSPVPASPYRLRYRLGRYERNIYALFEVTDDIVVRHGSDFANADASDHLELAMVTADGEFLRFAVDEAGDGSARVWLVGTDGSLSRDSRIEAALVETDGGYQVEMRIPRALIGARFAFAAIDIDDRESHGTVARLGTSETSRPENLSHAFVPSPELAALAHGLGRANSRLWVLDARARVLARAGTLQAGRTPPPPPTWRQALVAELRPLYGSILTQPTEDFTDQGSDATQLQGSEVTSALGGASARWRRRTTDGRAVVLSAAEPVWNEGKVVGVVLAEETTNETLAARNRAFERLFFSIALVALFGAVALLGFATRLSFRIRGLRNAVERAIDRQGRIRESIPPSRAGDEVGDLSRSFGVMLERQQQYTAYLEGLRSRLSHEIRTPVAVVRSSLDNLRLHQVPEPAAVYLDRADEGLSRLVTVVQRMTEASRLEQTLGTNETEAFDLAKVVTGCVEGYRLAHPQRRLDAAIETTGRAMIIEGAPDLVAQLLDKLVENALDFAREGTPVEIRLNRGLGVAFLAVSNEGPTLPDEVAGRIFESLVSSRPSEGSGKVHLGLGLTIVKAIADFHEATVSASNRRDSSGVTFTAAFPLQQSAPTSKSSS